MSPSLPAWLARRSGTPRGVVFRVIALVLGWALFLIVVPFVLGVVGHVVAAPAAIACPPVVRVPLAVAAIAAGLSLLAWCAEVFWFVGGGTPNPAAAPQTLVRVGPYAHVRNPIQAGAMIYYLGLGALFDSCVTGAVMFLLALGIGAAYHKGIEEKELRLRFGAAYDDYRRETPFLLPRLRRRKRTGVSSGGRRFAMSDELRIRPMTPQDAEAVAGLSTQLGYPASASEVQRRFFGVVQASAGAVFVAESAGGEVIGWLHVFGRHLLETAPFAEIGALVVDGAARRQGVGRALIVAAEGWARGAGYGAIRVRSNTARTVARPFYEARGYELIKTQYVFQKALD